MSLSHLVVSRYLRAKAEVLQFPKKQPSILIEGRRYALSDQFLSLIPMEVEEEEPEKPAGGGAKVIHTGPPRFSFLWVYDTDRRTVTMWRVSDGDEKAHGPASSYSTAMHRLVKKNQLNRVTNQEFRTIERWMHRRYENTLQDLKRIIEENKVEWDHRAKELVQRLFDQEFRPEIERRLREVDRGVTPFGFKVNKSILEYKTPEQQARQFVINWVLKDFTERAAYEYVEKATGIDPYNPPNGDIQAVQWAFHEVLEEFWDSMEGTI